jgi:hypothetical protein
MLEKDILELVSQLFDEHIYSSCNETILGLESEVEGKKDFMLDLELKLEKLIDKEKFDR